MPARSMIDAPGRAGTRNQLEARVEDGLHLRLGQEAFVIQIDQVDIGSGGRVYVRTQRHEMGVAEVAVGYERVARRDQEDVDGTRHGIFKFSISDFRLWIDHSKFAPRNPA